MMDNASGWRAKAPVFVLGSPRSGTTLLYDTILSSGNFVDYQAESNVFNRLGFAFGSLKLAANRRRLVDSWLKSDFFQRTGLAAQDIQATLESENWSNPGDFLRIVMEKMAHKQGVQRWAEKTPAHIHFIPLIKETIPDALFIHIIRDGRDSAMSLSRMGEGGVCPWDKKHGLLVCALYWQWHVQKGIKYGRRLGDHYTEVHYEELVRNPRGVLAKLGGFIQHDLSYERIQRNAIGVLKTPNSSYKNPAQKGSSPMERWRNLPPSELARLNGLVGEFLKELGYEVSGPSSLDFAAWRLRAFYPLYRKVRHSLKQTPLSQFVIAKKTFFRRGRLDEIETQWETLRNHADAGN